MTVDSPGRERVTVSMPADVAAMIRRRVGARGVSRYVTAAVQRQLEVDALGQLVDELAEASGGPLTTEELAGAAALWPDA
jgi:transcriptional regulator GlxA family with amidase domain